MRPAMGTLVHVCASGPEPAVQRSVDAALATVERIERLMSFHDPESELSRVNREAGRTPQTVHPWTWAVLRRALRVAEASAGLFDITVAPLLVRAGLLPGSADASLQCGNWRHIVLMPDCRVFLERPMLLDLGGIAKGFAVDRAIHELTQRRLHAGSGECGRRPASLRSLPHPVYLRRRDGLVQVAELRCGAIATSAPHATHAERLAQPLGSIFDPRVWPGLERKWGGDGRSAELRDRRCAHQGRGARRPRLRALLARFGARAMWDTDAANVEAR